MSESTWTLNPDGTKVWKNEFGMRHRDDGPAVEDTDGAKRWYRKGQRHREDGPAVEYSNGDSIWYFNGHFLGFDLKGFWALWECLDEEGRQNLNLHMWLRKLTNV